VAFDEGQVQFHHLLDKLPAGAYTCDQDGLITYFNQHAARIWGRSPRLNDPVDRFCGSFRLFASDGSPIAHDECWMALALRTGSEYNGHEIVIEHPDGGRLTTLAHANPIRDHSGALVGAVNVLVDISERKRAEIALNQAARNKDEFLAILAHELRNPLSPLLHALQILRLKPAGSADAQMALDVADRQLRQMTRLIDDLLDISRISQNKLELRKQQVELAEIVRAAVEISRPLMEGKRQGFTQTLPGRPVVVDADALRLAQALSNLLSNAAKYTEPDGRIWLAVAQEANEAVITVGDSGAGIPPEMLTRIFEMFVQGNTLPQRTNAGLGIGLALTRRLVEMHGGNVSAHSEGRNRGSRFVVRLPLVADAAESHASVTPVHAATVADFSLRILLVDDNRDAVQTLRTLLEMTGNEVRSAHDGEAALVAAESFRPDVIFLDIGLPKVNGWALAQQIRNQPWGQRMFLVAVSGWGQASDIQRSKDAGLDQHLVKPPDPAAIMQLLASLKQAMSTSPT